MATKNKTTKKNWVSVGTINAKEVTGTQPLEVKFPDNSVRTLKSWNHLPLQIVEWARLPYNTSLERITTPDNATLVSNTREDFPTVKNPLQSGNVLVFNHANARKTVQRSGVLIDRMNFNKNDFYIRFAPTTTKVSA